MRTFLTAAALVASALCLRADSVSDILARMDQQAPKFQAMKADLVMDEYVSLLDSHTNEPGTIEMQRLSPTDITAIIVFNGGDDAKTIQVQGHVARIYYPQTKGYQDYDLGANSGGAFNQYLLLGFGSSGSDLAKNYQITAEGSETIGGKKTTKLLMIPNSAAMKQRLEKVEIWVPEGEAYPIQQQFYEPTKPKANWRKVTYSNVVINPPIKGKLEFKLPKGAKKLS